MLDINLFREEKGHNPEIIRESLRRRYANVQDVDAIIDLDKVYRQCNYLIPPLILSFRNALFFFVFLCVMLNFRYSVI